MIEAAENAHPREAGGVIYDGHAYEIPNVAKKGLDYYIMDRVEQIKLHMKWGRPDGIWHSHPNGNPNPSHADLHYHPADTRMLIVANGEVHDHGVKR